MNDALDLGKLLMMTGERIMVMMSLKCCLGGNDSMTVVFHQVS